jgi:hypothetical protein
MRAITRSRVASSAVKFVTNTAIAIRRPSGSGMSPVSFVACANSIAYGGGPRLVSDARSGWSVTLQTLCPKGRCHPAQEQIRMLRCQRRIVADPAKQLWLQSKSSGEATRASRIPHSSTLAQLIMMPGSVGGVSIQVASESQTVLVFAVHCTCAD